MELIEFVWKLEDRLHQKQFRERGKTGTEAGEILLRGEIDELRFVIGGLRNLVLKPRGEGSDGE
jgi:hypothetical protein